MSDTQNQTQEQPAAMTPQQAYSNVISRQRDQALNRAAELEVHLAMVMQENAELKAALDATNVPPPVPESVQVNRSQRRAQKKG